jgi:N-acetyl-alpha-D-muramate 1-phosphate uridylyltransferase
MSVALKQAMVLAAGLGTRMRPANNVKPKPLVEVKGRTLIDRVLDRLIDAGIGRAVVNLHYKADLLRAHLSQRKDIAIEISDETPCLLDTGGGIAKALPHFGGAPFLTHNSDTIWIEGMGRAITRLAAAFDPERMDALMLMASTVSATGYEGRGDFTMDEEGRLARREEARVTPFVWAGVQIVHPRLFEGCPGGPFSTNLLWDRAIDKGRLYGLRHDGIWMHVGDPEGLAEAEARLSAL